MLAEFAIIMHRRVPESLYNASLAVSLFCAQAGPPAEINVEANARSPPAPGSVGFSDSQLPFMLSTPGTRLPDLRPLQSLAWPITSPSMAAGTDGLNPKNRRYLGGKPYTGKGVWTTTHQHGAGASGRWGVPDPFDPITLQLENEQIQPAQGARSSRMACDG
jgi:hypothetical protein